MMVPDMIEQQGKIAEIIFHNRENGYTVAVFETEEDAFTVVGTLPSAAAGRYYTLTGEFVTHRTYGEQFAIKDFREEVPSGSDAIREFLMSGAMKGIGRKTAAAIVDAFGDDTFDIIEKEPDRLTEVPGIGEKTAQKIYDAFGAHREFANITLYLQKFGISATYAMKLYDEYGPDTIAAIEENPYRIVRDIYGVGFKKADAIAGKMGIEDEDPHRITAGINYTLTYFSGEGNTFIPRDMLAEKAAGLLDVSMELIEDTLRDMAFAGDVVMENMDGRISVFLTAYYLAEQNVCRCLSSINNAKLKPIGSEVDSLIERTERITGIILSENQKTAVRRSLRTGVSVITGGPGTGKTTIINTIINILEARGIKTAIAAPTGRAAKRITETSDHEASTIHRLLEYYYSEGDDSMKFGKTAEDPLDYDAVIVDEASMIDLMLMNGLVSAVRPGTRLIIVGDYDQLPSVGAGNVLRDIISSEYIQCTKLTEIFRQAKESMIVVNAHRINHGEYPEVNCRDKDFFLLRRNGEREMMETIKDLCIRRLPAYYEGISPAADIQVLTPVRKRMVGSINLNKELQEVLNPPSEEKVEKTFGDRTFREGDKVMQIRNNYERKWKNADDFTDGEGVFNGDSGFISMIDTESRQLEVVYDDIKHAVYEFTQLDELELAYAVTVHKSQGSEFPIVIMPVSWFPPMLATRNLLYTGVTRGKRAVILVGSEDKLRGMVDNNRINDRYSGLEYRLRRLMDMEDERNGR